jgi:putative phage-type endonuclease
MSIMEESAANQRRLIWLDHRKKGLGASDCPVAMNMSPYNKPYPLFLEKTGEVESEDLSESEEVVRGIILERFIRERAAGELGAKVVESQPYNLVRSTEHPYMTATPDGIIEASAGVQDLFRQVGLEPPPLQVSGGTIQIKTVGQFVKANWEDGKCPDYYQAQCQHELIVTGLQWGILVAVVCGDSWKLMERLCESGFSDESVDRYIRTQHMILIPFRRDEEFCARIVEELGDFWLHVENRIPPAIDGSEATMNAIKRQYPRDDGETVSLPAEAGTISDLWDDLDAKIKPLVEQRDQCKARLAVMMGPAARGEVLGTGLTVTYNTSTRRTVNSAKLLERFPDVHAECLRETEYRTLRRSVAKPKLKRKSNG